MTLLMLLRRWYRSTQALVKVVYLLPDSDLRADHPTELKAVLKSLITPDY